MKKDLVFNPVMISVHLPIMMILVISLTSLLIMLGVWFDIAGGIGLLTEAAYFLVIQKKVEMSDNWIPREALHV